jgi:hypothetical protein
MWRFPLAAAVPSLCPLLAKHIYAFYAVFAADLLKGADDSSSFGQGEFMTDRTA